MSARRRIPAAVLAAACLLAACGGGGSGGGTGKVSGQKLYDWVACMRDAEIDVPTPTRDEDGNLVVTGDGFDIRPPHAGGPTQARFGRYSAEQMQDAQDVCGLPPMLAPGVASATLRAQVLARLRWFARCMRAHGVAAYPDPDPSDPLLAAPEVDQTDPQAPAATAACQGGRPG